MAVLCSMEPSIAATHSSRELKGAFLSLCLDGVGPRGRSRGEVEVPAGAVLQPFLDLGRLAGGDFVQDDARSGRPPCRLRRRGPPSGRRCRCACIRGLGSRDSRASSAAAPASVQAPGSVCFRPPGARRRGRVASYRIPPTPSARKRSRQR